MPHTDNHKREIGRGAMNGTQPITDQQSKSVMLRAERGDPLLANEIIQKFHKEATIPKELTVCQRVSTYYGTELLLEPGNKNAKQKFLVTAPGPDAFLYFWTANTDSDGFQTNWAVAAEVKMRFKENLPQYTICNQCGEEIESLEHEKLAAMDNCPGE